MSYEARFDSADARGGSAGEPPLGLVADRGIAGERRYNVKSETGSLLEAVLFRAGSKDPGQEKRKEARYPARDVVEIRILPDGQLMRATIIDVSRSGLRLELITEVAKNARIEVLTASKLTIVGEVRYCRGASGMFHAGVQIGDVMTAASLLGSASSKTISGCTSAEKG